jgi:hypothetical protein
MPYLSQIPFVFVPRGGCAPTDRIAAQRYPLVNLTLNLCCGLRRNLGVGAEKVAGRGGTPEHGGSGRSRQRLPAGGGAPSHSTPEHRPDRELVARDLVRPAPGPDRLTALSGVVLSHATGLRPACAQTGLWRPRDLVPDAVGAPEAVPAREHLLLRVGSLAFSAVPERHGSSSVREKNPLRGPAPRPRPVPHCSGKIDAKRHALTALTKLIRSIFVSTPRSAPFSTTRAVLPPEKISGRTSIGSARETAL